MTGVSWWSAGITSAVATHLALQQDPDIDIIFFETGQHHPDSVRFREECEDWYGKKIKVVQNTQYVDAYDVLRRARFINGPSGVPCTIKLKKKVRQDLEKVRDWDFQVLGFDFSKREINRSVRFSEQYPETNPRFPLIDQRMTKVNSAAYLTQAGIRLPLMYHLGYHNNNCIGCVQGGMGYWNKIRVDFPEVFERAKQLEEDVGASCLRRKGKRLFLKDLDPSWGRHEPPITSECGIFCAVEGGDVISPKTLQILGGAG